MRTRRSPRNQETLWRALGGESQPQTKPTNNPAWLTMTDQEIDRTYFNLGAADRQRMKSQAAVERQRIAVRQILEQEEQEQCPS